MPPCRNCGHAGSSHNWRVPPCQFRHDKDIPCANCLHHKELRRVRGSRLSAKCRRGRYVPDIDQPMALNRYNGRMLRRR
jgi:hypothetical protein